MKALRLKLYDNKLFGHSEAICGIYSPQGDKGGILVTVSKDGCLRGWDIFERKKISKIFLLRNPPATVTEEDSETKEKEAFDPLSIVECCIFNKKSVFCGYSDGSIYAYNMKTGNIVYIFQGHEDKVSGIEWIDANTFVTCAYDETIVFWDSMVSLGNFLGFIQKINKFYFSVLSFDFDWFLEWSRDCYYQDEPRGDQNEEIWG